MTEGDPWIPLAHDNWTDHCTVMLRERDACFTK
jgi:hypothetical protein